MSLQNPAKITSMYLNAIHTHLVAAAALVVVADLSLAAVAGHCRPSLASVWIASVWMYGNFVNILQFKKQFAKTGEDHMAVFKRYSYLQHLQHAAGARVSVDVRGNIPNVRLVV